MRKIIAKIKQNRILRITIGVIIGGLAGFAYYSFIGCSSGTCPITSSPTGSIVFGSIFGLLLSY